MNFFYKVYTNTNFQKETSAVVRTWIGAMNLKELISEEWDVHVVVST